MALSIYICIEVYFSVSKSICTYWTCTRVCVLLNQRECVLDLDLLTWFFWGGRGGGASGLACGHSSSSVRRHRKGRVCFVSTVCNGMCVIEYGRVVSFNHWCSVAALTINTNIFQIKFDGMC